MKYILILIGVLFTALAYSSLPVQVSLEKLVENSDHLLIGHVVGVDMIDGKGEEITDPSARTSPGSKNLIRLIVKVDEVIVSNVKNVPDTLKVPQNLAKLGSAFGHKLPVVGHNLNGSFRSASLITPCARASNLLRVRACKASTCVRQLVKH